MAFNSSAGTRNRRLKARTCDGSAKSILLRMDGCLMRCMGIPVSRDQRSASCFVPSQFETVANGDPTQINAHQGARLNIRKRRLACGPYRQLSEFVFSAVPGGRNHAAGDLAHMFAGIGELALQKFRLDAHRLLKIGGVNQLSRMLECRL